MDHRYLHDQLSQGHRVGWFELKRKRVLSIDISSVAVKTLELSQYKNRFQVESFAVVPFYQNLSISANASNTDVIADAIKTALNQTQSWQKQAAVAISGSAVITKIITLSGALNDSEIEEQILIEADQYVPYSLNEVNFDFEVQGLNKNNLEMIDVLFVASRRENVDERVEILSKAGLKTTLVDVEIFALENALTLLAAVINPKQNRTVAIVDIGATVTVLNVFHNGCFLYSNEQEFGSKPLSEELQRLGLSYSETYSQLNQTNLPALYKEEVLTPFMQSMLRQIQRSLQFFISSGTLEVDCLVLAGGCASIKGIHELIADSIGIPVYIANPFLNMDSSLKINANKLSDVAPAMMINCGLALRSFEL
jgi:type IV pilus assembly protein PilM